jgi:hypothetical protein
LLTIDGEVVAGRETAAEEGDTSVSATGETYEEFLEATGTKSTKEFGFFNVTNNLFSQHFGIAGWQISKEKADELGKPHFSDFLPKT